MISVMCGLVVVGREAGAELTILAWQVRPAPDPPSTLTSLARLSLLALLAGLGYHLYWRRAGNRRGSLLAALQDLQQRSLSRSRKARMSPGQCRAASWRRRGQTGIHDHQTVTSDTSDRRGEPDGDIICYEAEHEEREVCADLLPVWSAAREARRMIRSFSISSSYCSFASFQLFKEPEGEAEESSWEEGSELSEGEIQINLAGDFRSLLQITSIEDSDSEGDGEAEQGPSVVIRCGDIVTSDTNLIL